MDKKDIVIIDAILGTISMNFQRAVMFAPEDGSGPFWRNQEYINEAFRTLKKSLRVLIKGFDQPTKDFVKKLHEDIRYKAPEIATEAMTYRFLSFRTVILRNKPKVCVPIAFGKRMPKGGDK